MLHMAKQGNSTKQLKQTLGFWDLMSTAIGQIIGAGIMTLLGSAIALTGRSVPISFLIAAVLVVGYSIPKILICGAVRARGGEYTMIAMLGGVRMAGIYTVVNTLSNLSLAMYSLSFASYFISLFGCNCSVGLRIHCTDRMKTWACRQKSHCRRQFSMDF